MQIYENPEEETNTNNTAGSLSMTVSTVAAILMIAATAQFLPSLRPEEEFGVCFAIAKGLLPHWIEIAVNTLLIAFAIIFAFLVNKKHSFVRSTEAILPATMAILLTSNPVNTSYLGIPMLMLIVNLICLDIMMKSYNSENATTSMFAVATYLSV